MSTGGKSLDSWNINFCNIMHFTRQVWMQKSNKIKQNKEEF